MSAKSSSTSFRSIPPAPLAGSRSPILLTHICAGWRKIALAFPALWIAMEISCSDPACPMASTLGRSGFCPLSICMDGWCSGLDNVGPFIAAVLSHRARWQYLSLCLAAQPDNNYPCIGGSMPLLRHLIGLELVVCSKWPELSFTEAPHLRTAILNYWAAATQIIILPWAQLTSLTLKTMYLHECVPVLQQVANLTHCELELYDDFDGNPMNVVDVALPSLQSLTLNDPDPLMHRVDHPQIFVVPALCSLVIPERFLGHPTPLIRCPCLYRNRAVSSGYSVCRLSAKDQYSSAPTTRHFLRFKCSSSARTWVMERIRKERTKATSQFVNNYL
ncbi:hypothetical protein B0H14DRAFT_1338264 [Mycena olivaceomarginata]|nr:hypothetical protein B0H14DRAFT_1338264 [Mycena olivaceomarginata]